MNNQVPPEWLIDIIDDCARNAILTNSYNAEAVSVAIQARFDEAVGADEPLMGHEIYPDNVKLAHEHEDFFRLRNHARAEARARWQATNLTEQGE